MTLAWYTMALMVLAVVTVASTWAGSRPLRIAGLVAAFGWACIIVSQKLLGWQPPQLTVLTAATDMLTLLAVGAALRHRPGSFGLEIAGLALAISVVSHPLAFLLPQATFGYYLTMNVAMAVAFLGLIQTGVADVVALHGTGGTHHHRSGRSDRLASGREAGSWTRR